MLEDYIVKIRYLFTGILAGVIALAGSGCKDDPAGNATLKAPGAARDLHATAVNDSTVDLRWTAPVDSAGITGYRIVWSPAGGSTDSLDLPASPTALRVSNLKTGITYTFSLTARRDTLFSPPVTVQWRLVGPPKNLLAMFTDPATARLTWIASTDPVLTGYLASWKIPGGDSGYVAVPSSASAIGIPGLNSANSYTFWLRAANGDLLSSPVTATWNGLKVSAPSDLRASSISDTAIRLAWTPGADTGAISYTLIWRSAGVTDSMTAVTTDSSMTVGNLQSGKLYTFQVAASRGVGRSAAISVRWATATRYVNEPSGTTSLRMYEESSPYGSGLTIDSSLGGPRRVKAKNPGDPASVQLALWVPAGTPTTFDIGPAFGLPGYLGEGDFDSTVYISKMSYMAAGIDTWYSSTPLDQQIAPSGNVSAFTMPVNASQGMGFYVRTGVEGSYHYARVFIASAGGALLQGTYPNRYLDIVISYQPTPNLPYAGTFGVSFGGGPVARTRR
ncbi:MAG: finc [Chlorobi bacterium]|nr:finc [Chlorobiota bacterium]